MNSLIDDISTLTTIAKYNLEQLNNKCISIISHDVEESLRDYEEITKIDIGIGFLVIQHKEDTIRYKFIPSKKLDDTIVNTYNNRKSNLVMDIDKALGDRIQNTYKDLF